MIEDDGVAKVHGVRQKIRNRKDGFDLSFGGSVIIFAKKNGGFLEVWSLTRVLTELMENGLNGVGFNLRGLTAKDEIISKKNEWIGGQLGPKVTPVRFLFSSSSCNLMDNSFIAITKRYGKSGQPWRIPR